MGAIRPAWWAVRLLDVDVHPVGVSSSARIHASEIRIGISVALAPTTITVLGAQVALLGSAESLRSDWQAWRGEEGKSRAENGRPVAWTVVGAKLQWESPDAAGATLRGIDVTHDALGTRVSVAQGRLQLGAGEMEVGRATLELDAAKAVTRARSELLTMGWTAITHGPQPEEPAANGPTAAAVSARGAPARRARALAPTSSAPGDPLVSLPHLHTARTAASAVAKLLADHIQQGADIGVSTLTWKVTQDQTHVALTFGPGPFSLTRTPTQLDLQYKTSVQGGDAPLSVRVLLPTDAGDLVATVGGGPVSLAMLGVQEGALGLLDVGNANVDGKVRIVLAGDGNALTFDVDAGARGLSINQPRLASDAVHGLDGTIRARGALSADGTLRVDDLAATLGAFHVSGSGVLDQTPDHVTAGARFDIPVTACQSLLDSMPSGLLPALQGTRMAGTFGALQVRFSFRHESSR